MARLLAVARVDVAVLEARHPVGRFSLGGGGCLSVRGLGGGREITLGDLQALGLKAGINGMITGNYLTTLGQSNESDREMHAEMEMPVGAIEVA